MNPQSFQEVSQNKPEAIPVDVGQQIVSRARRLTFTVAVTLALTLGIVSCTLFWSDRATSAAYWFDLQQWVCALAAPVLLFDLYAFYQQLRLRRIGQQLAERDQLFQLVSENAADMIAVVDSDGRRLYNSTAYQKILGYSPEELTATWSNEQVHPDDRQQLLNAEEKVRLGGKGERLEYRMRHKDGSWRTLESIVCAMRHPRDQSHKLVIVNHDITERRHAEEKYRAIFEDAVVGIFQMTPEGRPLNINRALAQIHGYHSPEHFMAEVSNLFSQLFIDFRQIDELKRVLDEKGVVRSAEVEVLCRDRTTKWVLANVRAVRDSDGKVALHEGTLEDITDRKAAEKQVKFLAYCDVLTGLPNRTLLQDRLGKALAGSRRRKDTVALLFLDLDRFKVINDSLGHSFGDLLLRKVADRLMGHAREQDTVARIGGDEFVMVLTGLKDMTDAAVAAQRVMDTMITEFVIEGRSLSVNCSMGVSIFPQHGLDSETLIKNADAAMYSAKESGRNRFTFFSEEMNDQVEQRLMLEHGLRAALDRKEFFLMFQPQMDIATGAIVGLEALLRWQHPELGLVAPDRFIRIAEHSGLISPIGTWVLRTACAQARRWQDEGNCTIPVAVNVSAVQFRQPGFQELIGSVLSETGLLGQYLELELTESLLLSYADMTASVLLELKGMGLKLSIDDFGTGYSSLSYLKQFPFDKLKIDRSFIRDVAVNSDDAAITTAIIRMAKSLGLKVIAEGVENEAQMSFLRALCCDEIQGYYFSKPLTADEVSATLRPDPVQHAASICAPQTRQLTICTPQTRPQTMSTKGENRREYARIKVSVPFEIQTDASRGPIRGATTDLSLGGCYIESIFPFPIGTNLDIKLSIQATVLISAIVVTCDPQVGNGIRFNTMLAEDREALAAFLEAAHQAQDSGARGVGAS
ncbi:MAG TPA: EAL domain-containing protein [Terriglobales bacterium]|nr:EAL domain-containing protein [Terriglobales bacterium]